MRELQEGGDDGLAMEAEAFWWFGSVVWFVGEMGGCVGKRISWCPRGSGQRSKQVLFAHGMDQEVPCSLRGQPPELSPQRANEKRRPGAVMRLLIPYRMYLHVHVQ
jgi:hypothetical protein